MDFAFSSLVGSSSFEGDVLLPSSSSNHLSSSSLSLNHRHSLNRHENNRDDIDNANECTNRLSRLVNNPKFSDVVLVVGQRRYNGHRLLLANASYVFEQMLTSQSWLDGRKSELNLEEDDDCFDVFEDFLRYIYTGQVKLNAEKVLGLLVLADKYNVPDLKNCCSVYMRNNLVSVPDQSKAVLWYQYALACNCVGLQEACLNYIILNTDTVMQSSDWVLLDKENLTSLLQRSDMVVESEYALLRAVVRWLSFSSREESLNENLRDVLPFVRFVMILPEHLSEFEESAFEQTHHERFQPFLLSAYRYHALSIKGKKEHSGVDVGSPLQFLYRNYTDENYSIHVDVIRKSFRSCPRVSSKVERPLSLPISVCNALQDRQCKMKVTFFPQGYYTTSLWNGQLNLAKSTDQTKMIIAHRGGIEMRKAEISVIVYAEQNGVRYVDYAINTEHTFEVYGHYEIENIVDLEKLKIDPSPYVIEGGLYVKIFVRPFAFQSIPTPP